MPLRWQAEIIRTGGRVCVCVNTSLQPVCAILTGGDGTPKKFDWPAGAEMALEEGVVAGISCDKTSVARLEHKPRFPGQPGIATPPGAGL